MIQTGATLSVPSPVTFSFTHYRETSIAPHIDEATPSTSYPRSHLSSYSFTPRRLRNSHRGVGPIPNVILCILLRAAVGIVCSDCSTPVR